MWNIIYYQNHLNKKFPVQDFIDSLDENAKAKIINSIDLLEEFGIKLTSVHTKKLAGTPLWELRVLGRDNIRIFYIAVVNKSFLLLHGFLKKKQKTDKKEINTALIRLKDYQMHS